MILGPVNKDWITPTLQNGWVQYDPVIWGTAQYLKTPDQIVHFRGLIKSGTFVDGTVLFTLPSGYRPASMNGLFHGLGHNGASTFVARIDIATSGNVSILAAIGTMGNTWLSLNGISFLAEQ